MMPDPTPRRDQPLPVARAKEPVTLVAGDTVVVFHWHGDRWRHAVTHRGRSVAESIEGADGGDATWPASPAFVELSRVEARGTSAVVAVGLAGRSHFSASVTPDATRCERLRFEIAVRVHEAPGWLGSTYRTAEGVARVAAPHPRILPATVQWAYTIGPEGLGPAPAAG